MNKKYIILLLVLFLIVGLFAYFNFYNPNEVRVGDSRFQLPEGYHEGALRDNGDTNITNQYTSVFIHQYDDNNTVKYSHAYVKERNQSNFTTKLVSFSVGNKTVYKSTIVGQPQSLHYWFVENGKTYTVYTWDGNDNMDLLIKDMIASAH